MTFKIYTKKGDTGTTQLIGGTRVAKNDIRIESYGTIDELNSYLGLLTTAEIDAKQKETLREIQDRLFTIGSSLASDPEKSKMKIPDLLESDVDFLENQIDLMNTELPEMKTFILPGGNTNSAHAHVARCICRRAERQTIALSQSSLVEALIIKYLNRLSDYLFVLSRFILFKEKIAEVPWHPRMDNKS